MIRLLRHLDGTVPRSSAMLLGFYLVVYISLIIPMHMAAVDSPCCATNLDFYETQVAHHEGHDFHSCQICHNSGTIHVLLLELPEIFPLDFLEAAPAAEEWQLQGSPTSIKHPRAPPCLA